MATVSKFSKPNLLNRNQILRLLKKRSLVRLNSWQAANNSNTTSQRKNVPQSATLWSNTRIPPINGSYPSISYSCPFTSTGQTWFSTHHPHQHNDWSGEFNLKEPEFDWSYLCNPSNQESIKKNISNRKGVGDIDRVVRLYEEHSKETDVTQREHIWKELLKAAALIPNSSHEHVPMGGEENARLVKLAGSKREFSFPCKTAVELGESLGLLRTKNVVPSTGEKTYYFIDDLARLEDALIKYTLSKLHKKNFTLLSVPDMLYPAVIEGCGFPTSGERTQVYQLDPTLHPEVCLSGSAEMALVGYYSGENLNMQDLPEKLCSVSRCYRAETSTVAEEAGLYRVHQFYKVEMFCYCPDETGNESDEVLQEFLGVEEELFSDLNLHFRILEMPSEELGAPAHRKYDIEAWMPAKEMWGEISSASNCTDFQSRRHSIKYQSGHQLKHVHTINGTACALPRMIIALLENGQDEDGSIDLPEVLWPYMDGVRKLTNKKSSLPKTTWLKKVPKQS